MVAGILDNKIVEDRRTVMSKQKRRRKWRPADKLRIVLETLGSDGKLSAICRREGRATQSLTLRGISHGPRTP